MIQTFPVNYVEPVFRPPSEARSLILQVTNGCSWNRCSYCEMYTDPQKKFRPRGEAELLAEIRACGEQGLEPRRVFLADGDALVLSMRRLRSILGEIRSSLPSVSRVSSYYVLKSLSEAMLVCVPIVIALAAMIVMRVVQDESKAKQLGVMTVAGGISVCAYGYFGVTPTPMSAGFTFAPGIEAANARMAGIEDPLVGEAIIRGVISAEPNPDFTPFLFDGSGTLPNLWVSSLAGVTSVDMHNFYTNLPPFPYDEKTLAYVEFALRIDQNLKINVLSFRGVSGDLVIPWARSQDPTRVISTRVPMSTNAMCEECSL